MATFEVMEPQSVAEAASLLRQGGEEAKILAGGTALLIVLRQRVYSPKYLVNIKTIPGLSYIEQANGSGLRIGGLTTHRDIEQSPLVWQKFPVLAEGVSKVASVQVRNLGTIGGNLAYAEPTTDPSPILMALGAKVKIQGVNGERVLPVEDLFSNYLETTLSSDEIITEIQIPNSAPRTGGAYLKYVTRTAMDKAFLGVAAVLTLDADGACREAKIALGAAGPTPLRMKAAEGVITGNRLSDSVVEEAARAAAQEISPIGDVRGSEEYKREMARVFVKRAIRQAAERAAAS